ncbi:MAG TPA: MarR family winged helix-turn-helix transcriptional regulator [Candidatus Angelobacter sp.]|nr:MarR family winged helix-turn-helix transcriptional regulator [Candidatus Angelobacter sp.]
MLKGKPKPLNQGEYTALAEFRYQLRRYLRFMEEKAREAGQNPQQYQLILALKGLPPGTGPSIGALAERLQLNHNSMVELVDRCEQRGLVRRTRSGSDRRQVELAITAEGDAFLRKLASAGREELRIVGPILAENIQRLTAQEPQGMKHGPGTARKTGGSKKTGP